MSRPRGYWTEGKGKARIVHPKFSGSGRRSRKMANVSKSGISRMPSGVKREREIDARLERNYEQQMEKRFAGVEKVREVPVRFSETEKVKADHAGFVADIYSNPDYQLVTDSDEVAGINQLLNIDPDDPDDQYDGFYVKVKDDKYQEILGFIGDASGLEHPAFTTPIYRIRLPAKGVPELSTVQVSQRADQEETDQLMRGRAS